MCILFAKSYYDLSVLSISVMDFQKNEVWIGGRWVG